MTEIFDGKSAKKAILKRIQENIKKTGVRPVLAIIRVGNDQASTIYVDLKKKAGSAIGIEVTDYVFGEDVSENEIIKNIRKINGNHEIDGLIVQLPLPKGFNEDKVIESIDPKKDVDGFHKKNKRLLEEGAEPYFFPVLPRAIFFVLHKAFGSNFGGKKIVALVNSDIFGQVLTAFLRRKGINLEYVIRDSLPKEQINAKLQSADVIISVCGRPGLINKDNIKEGAVLIDAGITRDTDGMVKGDVDIKSVQGKAGFLTPVPGGIGPLTVALLLENVYVAAEKSN